MGILTNYIWERAADGGTNPVSLVLQQVKLKGREICLLCISSSSRPEAGGYMAEQLVEWFHKVCLPACEGRTVPTPDKLLEPELKRIQRELTARELTAQESGSQAAVPDFGGLLLIGSRFYLFGEGEVIIQLVNYRYNRPQLKPLTAPLSGRIQKGAGLLLHTPGLVSDLEPEEVCQILHGEGPWREERLGKRLKELYQESRSRGNTAEAGGIYLQMV